ncbi:hypothetical protein DFH09DRAFT_1070180 [Mycena vulgaris]|nr:hypothetical protein DFH09DRAFT_1070180 [Mycena vulgaris]
MTGFPNWDVMRGCEGRKEGAWPGTTHTTVGRQIYAADINLTAVTGASPSHGFHGFPRGDVISESSGANKITTQARYHDFTRRQEPFQELVSAVWGPLGELKTVKAVGADGGKHIWLLIRQLEDEQNRLVLFGKQSKDENTSEESKISVYQRIDSVVLPEQHDRGEICRAAETGTLP